MLEYDQANGNVSIQGLAAGATVSTQTCTSNERCAGCRLTAIDATSGTCSCLSGVGGSCKHSVVVTTTNDLHGGNLMASLPYGNRWNYSAFSNMVANY